MWLTLISLGSVEPILRSSSTRNIRSLDKHQAPSESPLTRFLTSNSWTLFGNSHLSCHGPLALLTSNLTQEKQRQFETMYEGSSERS